MALKSVIPNTSYLMIIGSMKSGTTSLYNYLKDHPEICPCKTKEPEYFSENQGHGIHADEYHDLFEYDPKKHKLVLEASTGYTKFPFEPHVPQNIKNYGLEPKFIYLVRNPFERILSQYYHVHKDRPELSFQDMYTYLIDYSKYNMQLEEYAKLFSKDRILVLDFEDLKTQPLAVLEKVCGFAGLTKVDFDTNLTVFNKTTGEPRRAKQLQKKVDNTLSFLPQILKRPIKQIIKYRYRIPKIQLDEAQKLSIYEDLKSDMHELQTNYLIDTTKWGF